jgi:hypothetical protein
MLMTHVQVGLRQTPIQLRNNGVLAAYNLSARREPWTQ